MKGEEELVGKLQRPGPSQVDKRLQFTFSGPSGLLAGPPASSALLPDTLTVDGWIYSLDGCIDGWYRWVGGWVMGCMDRDSVTDEGTDFGIRQAST